MEEKTIMREFKVNKKIEKEYLDKRNLSNANEEISKKYIISSLYQDQIQDDEELFEYINNNFSNKMSEKNVFDLLAVNDDSGMSYFVIFCDTDNDPNLVDLKRRIQLTEELIKSVSNHFANYEEYLQWFDDCSDSLSMDLVNALDEEHEPHILIYNLSEDDNDIQKIRNLINNDFASSLPADISILSSKEYWARLAEFGPEASSELGRANSAKISFNLYYDDPDGSQTAADERRNFIQYKGLNNQQNYIFSIKASSLIRAYDAYRDLLLEKNVRYGLLNSGKEVNDSIRDTVLNNPKEFWILNNGITIVTEGLDIDEPNKEIKLSQFNIVNGAQTLTNLWKIHNSVEGKKIDFDSIVIPAKIVKIPHDSNREESIINEVVRAANTQKAVKPRDLVSNNKEMKELKETFKQNGIVLNIKRGDENVADKTDEEWIIDNKITSKPEKTTNLILGQEVLSTIFLQPNMAIQRKNKLFDKDWYKKVFANKLLSSEDFVSAHIAYRWIEGFIKEYLSGNDFVAVASSMPYDTSNGDNDVSKLAKTVKELFIQCKPWVISAIYYAIYQRVIKNRDWTGGYKLDKTEIDNLNDKQKYDDKNRMYVLPIDDSLSLNANVLPEVQQSADDLLNSAAESLYSLYEKENNTDGKAVSIQVFSYRSKAFQQFIKNWITSLPVRISIEKFFNGTVDAWRNND